APGRAPARAAPPGTRPALGGAAGRRPAGACPGGGPPQALRADGAGGPPAAPGPPVRRGRVAAARTAAPGAGAVARHPAAHGSGHGRARRTLTIRRPRAGGRVDASVRPLPRRWADRAET